MKRTKDKTSLFHTTPALWLISSWLTEYSSHTTNAKLWLEPSDIMACPPVSKHDYSKLLQSPGWVQNQALLPCHNHDVLRLLSILFLQCIQSIQLLYDSFFLEKSNAKLWLKPLDIMDCPTVVKPDSELIQSPGWAQNQASLPCHIHDVSRL